MTFASRNGKYTVVVPFTTVIHICQTERGIKDSSIVDVSTGDILESFGIIFG